jgi:hypothetical protein
MNLTQRPELFNDVRGLFSIAVWNFGVSGCVRGAPVLTCTVLTAFSLSPLQRLLTCPPGVSVSRYGKQHSRMDDFNSSSGQTPEPRPSKRVVASRACDSCRTRRIRCLPLDGASGKSQTCKACNAGSVRCTFDLLNKKRGPPSKW